MTLALLCAGMMALASDLEPKGPTKLAREYQETRAKAGRSSEEQVRLALWCESRGMAAERLNHLTLAILADPANTKARALLGTVAFEGRFLRPEAIAAKLRDQPILAEYEAKRQSAPYTAGGQWILGVWADEHGLNDQARAHFTAVVRLDPRRVDAWKRLGYRQHQGRWMTDAQIAAEKADADAQHDADRTWKPALEQLRKKIAAPSKRAEALAELADIDDPRAVPSILRVFGRVAGEQPRAVQLLGQIDTPASTRALAILAIAGRSGDARRVATETLRGRDPLEYVKFLVDLLAEPIHFEVKHVGGIKSPGELLVEGKRVNLRRVYTPPPVTQPGDRVGYNASGVEVLIRMVGPTTVDLNRQSMSRLILPQDQVIQAKFNELSQFDLMQMTPAGLRQALAIVLNESDDRPILERTRISFFLSPVMTIPIDRMNAEAGKSAAAAERQLGDDVRVLEKHNLGIRDANSRVSGVLSAATGQNLPAERGAWERWWVDQIGYSTSSLDWTAKPAAVENVAIGYEAPLVPDGAARDIDGYGRMSCFGAGTPVRTMTGTRAIESLEVGDRVLTQDTRSGALRYRPILVVHRNPPAATYRIKLKGEPIVASQFHRFWVAGKGWVMARDLKAGDPIRTLEGVSLIESIVPDAIQPVYNLDVADDADFFAGPAAALVHDNTQPDPRLVPFDAKLLSNK